MSIPHLIIACWVLGLIIFYWPGKSMLKNRIGLVLIIAGCCIQLIQLIQLWVVLERPPFRTLGETRLWYSLFLPVIGLVILLRWKLKWMPLYSLALAMVFVFINLHHPENFDKTLMPALQSVWFVPHVVVYIFAYALLAAAAILALKGLFFIYFRKPDPEILKAADNLVYTGFSFLTFGLLFGALWAKEAWGHYWTWDPKETWAFITWLLYLLYIHFRHHRNASHKMPLWILALAFVVLLICWFGINYLPSAVNSVHTYSS